MLDEQGNGTPAPLGTGLDEQVGSVRPGPHDGVGTGLHGSIHAGSVAGQQGGDDRVGLLGGPIEIPQQGHFGPVVDQLVDHVQDIGALVVVSPRSGDRAHDLAQRGI